jgi:ribosomal protein S18 acetylase RimI-like enzyme
VAQLIRRPSHDAVLDFCAEEPIERVFLEDVARRGLGRFSALAEDRRLVAICHAGANLVPSGSGAAAFADLAARSRPRMIVGEERAVGELWGAVSSRLPAPLDDRPGQPVYVVETPPAAGRSGLRRARLTDLELLVPACAAAYLEEVGVDAHRRDPALSEWRTRAQIEAGRSWLWTEGSRILFKAEASAWTEHAVQLQQVWVEPGLRGRGYAKQALADLLGLLLESTPAVCLFVRPDNSPAIGLYESLGMRRTIAYRSLIFG